MNLLRKPRDIDGKQYQARAYLSAEEKSWLNHMAAQMGISESSLIAIALNHYRNCRQSIAHFKETND